MDKLPGYYGVKLSDLSTLTNVLQKSLRKIITGWGGERVKAVIYAQMRESRRNLGRREMCKVGLAELFFILILFLELQALHLLSQPHFHLLKS